MCNLVLCFYSRRIRRHLITRRCLRGWRHRLLLHALLVLLHEGSQHSYFGVSVELEVEPIFLGQPQVQEVVVEGLLGDAYLPGCRLQSMNLFAVCVEGLVQAPPEAHFLDDLLNRPLLDTLFVFAPCVLDFHGR